MRSDRILFVEIAEEIWTNLKVNETIIEVKNQKKARSK